MSQSRWINKPPRGIQLNKAHPITKDMVCCLPINEGAGGRLLDYSGYGNHGVFPLADKPTWKSNYLQGVAGVRGVALGDTSTVKASLNFSGNDPITIFQILDGTNVIDGDWSIAQYTEIVLRKNASKLEFILNSFSANDRVSSISDMPSDVFAAAGVYDGSKLSVFLNNEKASTTPSGTYGGSSDEMCIFNAAYNADLYDWPGRIYLTYIWRRALSDEEILSLNADPYQIFEPSCFYVPETSSGSSLLPDNSNNANTIDNVNLTQKNTLSINNAQHTNSLDNVNLTQASTLSVDGLQHANLIDNIVLSLSLIVNNLLHSHSIDNVTLSIADLLQVEGLSHGHAIDNLDLIQAHNLIVNSLSNAHTIDNINLDAGITGAQIDFDLKLSEINFILNKANINFTLRS